MGKAFKVITFIVVLGVMIAAITYVLKPAWFENNHYDTLNGFYEQPENTIDTIFLGASQVAYGITTTELYEDYGICAYNLGTANQAMLISYYWMLEAYDYQEESLDVIVLDVSMLRRTPGEYNYPKNLLDMKYSMNKYNAVKDIADTLDDFLSYTSSLVAYHTRWKELTETDFSVWDYEVNTATRGYNFTTIERLEDVTYEECNMPNFVVSTDEVIEFEEESMIYFERIAEFCEDNDIQLVLTKVPTTVTKWTDEEHNAAEALAEEYGLEFYDFNYLPLLDEIDYNGATYGTDFTHMSYYGATAVTDWFGEYLTTYCDVPDVRGLETYAYMDEDLAAYKREIFTVTLDAISDPYEYIQAVNEYENYSILISVKDDATKSLTQEQLDGFADLGLSELAQLEYQGTYIALIEDGQVMYEESKNPVEGETTSSDLSISQRGYLMDGTFYILESGGGENNDSSIVSIDMEYYSRNSRGINIVVYDQELGMVIDSVVFDTYESSTRIAEDTTVALEEELASGVAWYNLSEDALNLYLYNQWYEEAYAEAISGNVQE